MDDELFQLGASSQKQTLSISSSFVQRARPTFWLDLNRDQVVSSAPYVTHLISIPSSSILSYTDDGVFRTHDRSSLSVIGNFEWKQGGTCSAIKPVQNGFIAAGKSGVIGYWDTRQNTPTISLQGSSSNTPYLSLAANTIDTNIIAAGTELNGTDAKIDLWDIRKPEVPFLSYLETHSDDITSLDFHPTLPNILLSAASDALIAISDTRQQNEDDSVIGVINAGASVARAGWGGSSKVFPKATPVDDDEEASSSAVNLPPLGAFYGVSDMQTVGIWEADGFSEVLPVRDVRQTQMETNIPSHRHWQTEYIIDANYDSSLLENPESIGLFCGEQNGGMALMEIPHDNTQQSSTNWSLHCLSSGGHTDIVRSVTWDPSSYILYSGGEDGRLCAWSLSGDQSVAQSNAAAAIASSLDASNNDDTIDSASDDVSGPGPKRKPLKGSVHSSSPLNSGRTASNKSYRPY